jgi:hypothetical protein
MRGNQAFLSFDDSKSRISNEYDDGQSRQLPAHC